MSYTILCLLAHFGSYPWAIALGPQVGRFHESVRWVYAGYAPGNHPLADGLLEWID